MAALDDARPSFRERDPVRVGVTITVVLVLVLVVAFNAHAVIRYLGTYRVEAVFSEAGGLERGGEVRIAGRPVGDVTSVSLEGSTVLVRMRIDRGTQLGGRTQAQIRTATVLGRKYVMLIPGGAGNLGSGDRIPLARTKSAYDLVRTLADLSDAANGIDTRQLAEALDGLSTTFEKTPTQFSRALDGVQGLSSAIADRDAALKEVFRRSAEVSKILAGRKDQVEQLIVDGELLASELLRQRAAIETLFEETSALTDELARLVDDGRKRLRPALLELKDTLALVNKNRKNLASILERLGPFIRSLGEAVGSGPFFLTYIGNFTPEGFPTE